MKVVGRDGDGRMLMGRGGNRKEDSNKMNGRNRCDM